MKCNLFCLACLSLAALAGAFFGADPAAYPAIDLALLFWAIIVVGLIPAALQLGCEECRALRAWLRSIGHHRAG